MKKLILSDCDGCLLDWNKGFENFMKSKGLPKLPNTDTHYSIALRHGITMHQSHEFIREFNEGSYIENLEPLADSVEYVSKLVSEGFRFTIITSIGDSSLAKIYRTKNLINVFGDIFDEINCLPMHASKSYELSKWEGTGYFWIEDHMRHAEAGFEAGLRSVLINHPYNTHYNTDLFPFVSCKNPWKEIYKMVHKVYNM